MDIDKILAFGYEDPTFIHDIHVLIGGEEKIAQAKAQIEQAILEARLSEVEKATNYIHPHELQDRIAELTKLLEDMK